MNTSLNVAHAWQRLRRQSLLVAAMERRAPQAANADDFGHDDPPFHPPDALPMLYRSEAFAEDLLETHPQHPR